MSDSFHILKEFINRRISLPKFLLSIALLAGLWLISTGLGGIIEIEAGGLWNKLRPVLEASISVKLWILGIIVLSIAFLFFCVGVIASKQVREQIRDLHLNGVKTDEFMQKPQNISFGELASRLVAVKDGNLPSSEYSHFILQKLNEKIIDLKDARRFLYEVGESIERTKDGSYILVKKV